MYIYRIYVYRVYIYIICMYIYTYIFSNIIPLYVYSKVNVRGEIPFNSWSRLSLIPGPQDLPKEGG